MKTPGRRYRHRQTSQAEGAARAAIWLANKAVDLSLLLIIMLLIAFGVYSLWDTQQIYGAADAKQFETYKPVTEEESPSFSELIRINSDVFAWLDVYGINIDYPVLWNEDNNKYLNMDPEGNFSLSGSLFLDAENRKDFSDPKNIIYGHHMEKEKMFGSIDRFGEKEFFDSHQYGNLYYNFEKHGLAFFAFVEGDAYDSNIYGIRHRDHREAESTDDTVYGENSEAAAVGSLTEEAAAGVTASAAETTATASSAETTAVGSPGSTAETAATGSTPASAETATVDNTEFLSWLRSHAKHWREIGVSADDTVVLLSTCASGETNLRYILVGVLTDQTYEDTFEDDDRGPATVLRGIADSIWHTLPRWWYLLVAALIAALIWIITRKMRRRRQRRYRRH